MAKRQKAVEGTIYTALVGLASAAIVIVILIFLFIGVEGLPILMESVAATFGAGEIKERKLAVWEVESEFKWTSLRDKDHLQELRNGIQSLLDNYEWEEEITAHLGDGVRAIDFFIENKLDDLQEKERVAYDTLQQRLASLDTPPWIEDIIPRCIQVGELRDLLEEQDFAHDYTLRVEGLPPTDGEVDENVLSNGIRQNFIVSVGLREYRFELDRPASVRLTTECEHDLQLAIFDASRDAEPGALHRDDDSGEGNQPLLEVELAPGRYRVEVTGATDRNLMTLKREVRQLKANRWNRGHSIEMNRIINGLNNPENPTQGYERLVNLLPELFESLREPLERREELVEGIRLNFQENAVFQDIEKLKVIATRLDMLVTNSNYTGWRVDVEPLKEMQARFETEVNSETPDPDVLEDIADSILIEFEKYDLEIALADVRAYIALGVEDPKRKHELGDLLEFVIANSPEATERLREAAKVFEPYMAFNSAMESVSELYRELLRRWALSGVFGLRWEPESWDMQLGPGYGVLPLLAASFVITVMAIFIALPFSIGGAVYISDFARDSEREILKPFIEILAGIPSVVMGFFGLIFLAPHIADLFGIDSGLNGLTAAIMLAFMAVPTILSISEDALRAVPKSFSNASLALGASKWQTAVKVKLPAASSGIVAAVMLGIGRVIGETMTVLMVAGMAPRLTIDPLNPMRPMTATIANEMGEAPVGGDHYQMLFLVGFLLLAISFGINIYARHVLRRQLKRKYS